MALFRREPPIDPPPATPPLPTEFVGIAGGSTGFPYEFHTSAGVPVRLHDMSFEGLTRRTSPPGLTMRFRYDDPRWTPTEAVSTPVAVFSFSRVQIWQWEDDPDLFEVPDDARGQVSSFDWYASTNTFELATISTTLLFSADRLTVHLEPLPSAE
jgi:hypothetical protein